MGENLRYWLWASALCTFASMGSTQPIVMVEAVPPLCNGSGDGAWLLTLQQGAEPVSFQWANLSTGAAGSGTLPGVGAPFRLEPLQAGDYRFTFIGSDGATSILQKTLTAPPPLEGHFFVLDPPNPCAYAGWAVGFLQVKGGTPPYQYLWSDGSNNARLDSLSPGWWSAEAMDAHGCRVQVDTLVQLPGPLEAEVEVRGESCAGRRDGHLRVLSTKGGVGPYLFSLNGEPSSTETHWEELAPGLHLLSLKDVAGCVLQIAAVVPEGLPFALDAGPDAVLFVGDTLRRPIVSTLPLEKVSWSPTRGVVEEAPDMVVIAPPFSTTYQLTALSSEGCMATTTLHVEVRRERKVYAPNAFGPLANAPENRVFSLYAEAGAEEIVHLQIFDRQGQLCFERQRVSLGSPAAAWDGSIGGRIGQPGVYTWIAVLRYSNGKEVLLQGNVTLVR